MEPWKKGYLIIAGSVDGKGKSQLYEWAGGAEQPRLLPQVDFAGINPEALTVTDSAGVTEIFVVSDDGTRLISGIDCKKLRDPMKKTFRGAAITLGAEFARKQ